MEGPGLWGMWGLKAARGMRGRRSNVHESDCLPVPDLAWYELILCSASAMIWFDIVIFDLYCVKLFEERMDVHLQQFHEVTLLND